MDSRIPRATHEERRSAAMCLVGKLDPMEILVLVGLVRGMSNKAIAAGAQIDLEDAERFFSSLMNKLKASRVADAVRIGLYAEVDRPDVTDRPHIRT